MKIESLVRSDSGSVLRAWFVAMMATVSVGLVACSEAAEAVVTEKGGEAAGGAAGGAPETPNVAGVGGALGAAGAAGAAAAGAPGESPVLDAPEDEAELRAFIAAGSYREWAKEAEFHASAGPHGASVRTYFSPKAAAALRARADVFPLGAAAIKEAANDAGVYGHSVWVKVQADSDAGRGFFWYEVFVREDGSEDVYGNARGSSVCVGCHSVGQDYNRSTLPIE